MLAPEGYPTILTVFITTTVVVVIAILSLQGWTEAAVMVFSGLVFLFTVLFFRDPERSTPADDNLVIAPADGRVVLIRDIENSYLTGGKGTQISIFLSLANVHVNRVPVSGRLEHVDYYPGKFLTAWKEEASELNEQAHFSVLHPSGKKFLFKQITGLLARRIVYHIQAGDELTSGDRFGIMKFGSRMDVLVPGDVEVTVRKGERTVGGETVLGVIQS